MIRLFEDGREYTNGYVAFCFLYSPYSISTAGGFRICRRGSGNMKDRLCNIDGDCDTIPY
ncbi:MAG: hypothetical protein U5O15_09750 [Candidatus Krumholzibacteriota bacterium]|nr:hypothetical protein [Candidatus Krumholzibacteriota bacterium]